MKVKKLRVQLNFLELHPINKPKKDLRSIVAAGVRSTPSTRFATGTGIIIDSKKAELKETEANISSLSSSGCGNSFS